MENSKLEVVMIDPEKLKPYFRNPRNNDKTVEALVKIIPRVGFNVPIVVDKNMVIIKGHSRWNASRILGLKEVPCIISEASEEQNNKRLKKCELLMFIYKKRPYGKRRVFFGELDLGKL